MKPSILHLPLKTLFANQPWIGDYFSAHDIDPAPYMEMSFGKAAASLDDGFFAVLGTDREQFVADFVRFVEQMQGLAQDRGTRIQSLTVLPGRDKDGGSEPIGVTLRTGEVTAVIGPTGSGKSRLLEDVECLAQRDTPTLRSILINDQVPTDNVRFTAQDRLVAQLSQNMSFVMDLSVEDFLTMHAESRMVTDIGETVRAIFEQANALAGEPFRRNQPVTGLSGGQSRALMIADTALLSAAPVVLIDEIENAGVDKIKALGLLVSAQKIVIISTHDPLLALSADQRLIVRNGAIRKVLSTTEEERCTLERLKQVDEMLADIRTRLRRGETIVG